jgi:hypothetical protein
MRCCGGWYALAEVAGTLDSLSEFFIAAIVALVLACLWSDASKLFKPHTAQQRQEQELRRQVVDPAKARWHSSQPPDAVESEKDN